MKIEDVKHVTVIGAGAMGRQIAMNTALNGRKEGYQVVLTDSFENAVDSARAWAADYLKGRVDKGRITQEEADTVSSRLTFTTDVDEGVKDAELVVEAIIEDLEIKKELFGRISKIVKADAILATNSSNLVSSKLAGVTRHPERLMNLHYFNPALVMKLVEVVKGPHTSDEAVECARAFGEKTGKAPIVIQKEIRTSSAWLDCPPKGDCRLCGQPHQRRRHPGGLPAAGEGHRLGGGHRHRLRKGPGLPHGPLQADGYDRPGCELLRPPGPLR